MTHDNFLLILVLKLVLYNGITIFVRFKFLEYQFFASIKAVRELDS